MPTVEVNRDLLLPVTRKTPETDSRIMTDAKPVNSLQTAGLLTPHRNLAAWASGFLGIAFGIAVGAGWQAFQPDSLSSRQLSFALGIHHWRYKVPLNAESQVLTFEFRDGDTVKTSGGSTGWKPGETIAITVRTLLESKKLECSMIGANNHHGRFLLENPFATLNSVHYADDGAFINEHPLIMGSHTGPVTVMPAESSKPGDVSLWVVMESRPTTNSE